MKLFGYWLLSLTAGIVVFVSYSQGSNVTLRIDDLPEDDILRWKPPSDIRKKFVYFLSGHDKEGLPVWVVEWSKWDLRTFLEEGKHVEEYNKYMRQAIYKFARNEFFQKPGTKAAETGSNSDNILISDFANYPLRQVTHLPTVLQNIQTVQQWRNIQEEHGGHIKVFYFVNLTEILPIELRKGNIYARILWGICYQFFGKWADHVKVYGTNKDEWQKAILKHIDPDQIPEWLGGSKDHKRIKVFG